MNKYAEEFQLKFDEINKLTTTSYKTARDEYGNNDALVAEKVSDDILSMMVNGYRLGVNHVHGMLDWHGSMDLTERDLDDMEEAFFVLYDGKTYADRVKEHVANDDIDGMKRVAETEYHRCYNVGGLNTARDAGDGITKTWYTQLDDRVRETHEFLETVTVNINEEFHTIDGDSALAPGLFNNASNNINCRCIVLYNRQ